MKEARDLPHYSKRWMFWSARVEAVMRELIRAIHDYETDGAGEGIKRPYQK